MSTQPNKTEITFGKLKINIAQYASQGNAILGIRGSGKTYTGTYLAEKIMDAGIPIVVFDPIGVWRFLRVGKNGGKAYPVVVAGGEHGDLPLTPESAPEILRAAMQGGVSIVFDLYSMDLSKADWKRIVQKCLRVLLYENKNYGLRHVIIEEAAEFCPQMVRGDEGMVFAEVQKLARMGGNAQLGYTLINQRAEEVNKSVLELCDGLFLHRQKGRNSLNAIVKWLDVGSKADGAKIAQDIAVLPPGECYAWAAEEASPVRIKIPAKKTFHPDRKAMQSGKAETPKPMDVSAFVSKMSGALETILKEAEENDVDKLKDKIKKLERGNPGDNDIIAALKDDLKTEYQRGYGEGEMVGIQKGYALALQAMKPYLDFIQDTAGNLDRMGKKMREEVAKIEEITINTPPPIRMLKPREIHNIQSLPAPKRPAPTAANTEGLTAPQQKILDALALLTRLGVKNIRKNQVAVFSEASPTSSSYGNNLGRLRTLGYIDYPVPGTVTLTDAGEKAARWPDSHKGVDDFHEAWRQQLTDPQCKILDVVLRIYPRAIAKEELAIEAGASPTSSSYGNNLGAMRSLGILDYPQKGMVVATHAMFLKDAA